ALVIGAAGAFNNVYDRDIDAIMPRTKNRPTVTGEMSAKSTMSLAIIMLVVGVAVLALASPLAALFGFLGVFLYVVPYTM
ncbi:UbiA family prenyltransferase, partial [Bacillus sp. SIMBA_005]